MTDGEGPGVRAERPCNKRWRVFGGIYAVVATALVVGLMMGRRDPAAGFPPLYARGRPGRGNSAPGTDARDDVGRAAVSGRVPPPPCRRLLGGWFRSYHARHHIVGISNYWRSGARASPPSVGRHGAARRGCDGNGGHLLAEVAAFLSCTQSKRNSGVDVRIPPRCCRPVPNEGYLKADTLL